MIYDEDAPERAIKRSEVASLVITESGIIENIRKATGIIVVPICFADDATMQSRSRIVLRRFPLYLCLSAAVIPSRRKSALQTFMLIFIFRSLPFRTSAHIWPNSGRLGEIRPSSGQMCPHLGRIRRPTLADWATRRTW